MPLLENTIFDPAWYRGEQGAFMPDFMRQIMTNPDAGGLLRSPGFEARPTVVPSLNGTPRPDMGETRLTNPGGDGEDDVTLPANAQPTGGMLSGAPSPAPRMAAPMEEPQGLLAGIGLTPNMLINLGAGIASGNGMADSIAKGISGLAAGREADQKRAAGNQTYQALVRKGIDPTIAQAAIGNPDLMKTLVAQAFGPQNVTSLGNGYVWDPRQGKAIKAYEAGEEARTETIKEYQFAKNEGFKGSLQEWIAQKRAGAGEYSLNPVYGTDKDGNTVLIQTGKSGQAIQSKLPEGVKISSGVDKIDLGTKWGLVDKRTGQIVGEQPKDIVGAEKAKEVGSAQGTAAAKIPAAVITAETTAKQIQGLLDSKGFESIFGSLDQYRPSWTMGASGKDALARWEQLQGTGFLQAFETLKGGGAITEMEGRKAGDAIARLQRYQSEAEARQALQDFKEAVETGMRKLRAAAGETGAPVAQTEAPVQTATPRAKPGQLMKIDGVTIQRID